METSCILKILDIDSFSFHNITHMQCLDLIDESLFEDIVWLEDIAVEHIEYPSGDI